MGFLCLSRKPELGLYTNTSLTYSPPTHAQRLWLMVKLGYTFNAHACTSINWHREEPKCSFQTLRGRLLIGKYTTLFSEITYMFSYHDQSQPPCISLGDVGMTMIQI